MIVVGGGHTAIDVVNRLARVMAVTLVDRDHSQDQLSGGLDGARFLQGDATSMLVLREAGVEDAYALIAATRFDDVNIEACRLAIEAGVPEAICRLTEPSRCHEVMSLGARPVTTASALSGALSASLPGVVVTTSEVGLGQGDILQVRVMTGSLVIGHRIADIATREYLVAAIYRDGELVVPHGDTEVQAGDQVLLVGHPDTLRAVADYFRLGGAQFPRQFGRAVILWDPTRDPEVRNEATWLQGVTGVPDYYELFEPDADKRRSGPPEPLYLDPNPRLRWKPVTDAHPGIYVLRPPRRTLFGHDGSETLAALLERASSPILLARGTSPYRRILVPLDDSETAWLGLELAVDIARLMDARITALHVAQPQYIGGSQGGARTERVRAMAEQVARLYGLPVDVQVAEGNPIRQVEDIASDHQLLVVTRTRQQENSYFEPDVGLRMALRSPCSVVLLNRS